MCVICGIIEFTKVCFVIMASERYSFSLTTFRYVFGDVLSIMRSYDSYCRSRN
jgi:hypothetical protein